MTPSGFTTTRVGNYDVLTPIQSQGLPNTSGANLRPPAPLPNFRPINSPPLRLVPPMQNPMPMPPQSIDGSGFPGGFPPGGVGLPPPGSDGSGPTPFRLEPLPPQAPGGQIVPAGPNGQLTFAQRLQQIPWWGWLLIAGGGYMLYKYHKRGRDPRFWGAPA